MEVYDLEKWIWTDLDFEIMGWHDSRIWGFQINTDLILDIDYIFQWNKPDIEGLPYSFWISPSTLIFQEPKKLKLELTQSFTDVWLEIDDIELTPADNGNHWNIITQQGEISFTADAFQQIIRQKPSLQFSQYVPYDERGGITFENEPGNSNDQLNPDIKDRKEKELNQFEIFKEKFILKQQLDELQNKKIKGLIDTKDYILAKKEINSRIEEIKKELMGTLFEKW